MNKHIGTIKRWRVQIFAITWLAYAAFYFTRKAFSVAKLGIAEDPTFMLDKMAMANLDADQISLELKGAPLGHS